MPQLLEGLPVSVKRLLPHDTVESARWDAFVMACPEATFFHRAGWQNIVRGVFHHDTYFLYAEAGGVIQGVLPLGHVNSWLFGSSLVGLPFAVYGGVAARTSITPAPGWCSLYCFGPVARLGAMPKSLCRPPGHTTMFELRAPLQAHIAHCLAHVGDTVQVMSPSSSGRGSRVIRQSAPTSNTGSCA